MKTLQTRRAVVLQDTIQYYSQDPDGRRCSDDNSCSYSPNTLGIEATSEGCAVGRLLSAELREELDRDFEGKSVGHDLLFRTLPKEVQELGLVFLLKLQNLHDSDVYWDSKGLSKVGEEEVQRIEEWIYM